MEQIVSIPEKVIDLGGLYQELCKNGFACRNVAMDHRGTYIYLEENEEKDPTLIAETFVGRPAPDLSDRAALEKWRAAAMEPIKEDKPPEPPKKLPWYKRWFGRKRATPAAPAPPAAEAAPAAPTPEPPAAEEKKEEGEKPQTP